MRERRQWQWADLRHSALAPHFWNGADGCRSSAMPRTSADGATATSKMVANNVCSQAVATVTSMADMRRLAVRLLLDEKGRLLTGGFEARIIRAALQAPRGYRRDLTQSDIPAARCARKPTFKGSSCQAQVAGTDS